MYMQLVYKWKKEKEDILTMKPPYSFSGTWNKENNLLIHGDNLVAMQLLIK